MEKLWIAYLDGFMGENPKPAYDEHEFKAFKLGDDDFAKQVLDREPTELMFHVQ